MHAARANESEIESEMESGNGSTTVPQATITTGSFQNQSPVATSAATQAATPAAIPAATPASTPAATPRSRKRGISSLLQDITNTGEPQSRRSAVKAMRTIESQSCLSAPRGNPVQGSKVRHNTAVPASTNTVHEPSLLQLLSDESVVCNIADNLAEYTQRNVAYEVQKALAINIMLTAISKWNCSIVEAATRAADCCGFNQECVRRWASAFVTAINTCSPDDMSDKCITDLLSSNRGHCSSHDDGLLQNEEFCLAAREYVHKNTCRKGQPNLTCRMFASWLENKYSTKIHDDTARRWLIKLGFSRLHHQKGVYFDGHDREDVVAYRNSYLTKMDELDKTSLTCYDNTPPELEPGQRPLIRVVHDECTFYANCDQSLFWGDNEITILRSKSLGVSIMVSDFIDERAGYVRDGDERARLLIEPQRWLLHKRPPPGASSKNRRYFRKSPSPCYRHFSFRQCSLSS